MNIIIFGGSGLLGQEFFNYLDSKGHNILSLSSKATNIVDYESCYSIFDTMYPDIVINCAALLAGKCEEDPINGYAVNAIGSFNLAKLCSSFHIRKYIFISSNMVFDGMESKYYSDHDVPNPISVYGKAKLAGEYFSFIAPQAYVIRTAGLFGKYKNSGKKSNFIDTVMRAEQENITMYVKNYEFSSMTYTLDLVSAINEAIIDGSAKAGIYHIVNDGFYNWYSIAEMAIESNYGIIKPVDRMPSDLVPRPQYGVLQPSFTMPSIANAIKRYKVDKRASS